VADYAVANEIAAHLARQMLERGDPGGALRLVERQIGTEPGELRAIEPGPEPDRLSIVSARLAGSFQPLHDLAAGLSIKLGRNRRAEEHARRAEVLKEIDTQFRRSEALP